MKQIYIKDLKAGDIINNEMFAIQHFDRMETKDKKPYIKLILIDKTGQIHSNIWADNIVNVERGALSKGEVVFVDAKVDEYKGALQLNILKLNKASEQYIEDFVEGGAFPIDTLWKKLENYISTIKSESIKQFLNKLFENKDIKERYMKFPAGEYVHHGFQGGLLEHVVEMIDLSMPLKEYYPEANYDYIIASIVIHDIGKIYELEKAGITFQRSVQGYLIGHISLGLEILIENGKAILSEKEMLHIKHILLSHHGELEWGSPIKPATIEAVIVHKVDLLSSQVRSTQRIMKSKVADELGFTEFDRIAGTKIFIGNDVSSESPELL